jgi:hypothetical protein
MKARAGDVQEQHQIAAKLVLDFQCDSSADSMVTPHAVPMAGFLRRILREQLDSRSLFQGGSMGRHQIETTLAYLGGSAPHN